MENSLLKFSNSNEVKFGNLYFYRELSILYKFLNVFAYL